MNEKQQEYWKEKFELGLRWKDLPQISRLYGFSIELGMWYWSSRLSLILSQDDKPSFWIDKISPRSLYAEMLFHYAVSVCHKMAGKFDTWWWKYPLSNYYLIREWGWIELNWIRFLALKYRDEQSHHLGCRWKRQLTKSKIATV